MNKSLELVFVIVTVFLLASSVEVECRRTYSSRSSSSGRGNRGKNQPSSGGVFSSWFGSSKSSGSSSGSGSIAKPSPTSAKKNWQTATSHATSQSKSNSNWANPYYKSPASAPLPSAPKEPNYGWKPAPASVSNPKPAASFPSSNIGPRGYPVQTGVQQGSQTAFAGYKPASSIPQTNLGGYRPPSNVPNTHATGFHPSPHQNNYNAYPHSSQPSHSYHPSMPHQPSYHPPNNYPHQTSGFSNYHPPPYTGYSSHAVPTYQGSKLFGGSTGHYGYPGSGSWGIDTYGARKSSGTGKLLTGLAVGAAGGYLTSSLVNSLSNPWKYSGYGYGSRFGYGSGYGPGFGSSYDYGRAREESAFERGFEHRIHLERELENAKNKEQSATPPPPEDPTSKWVQCVAFDPQTQQTLINPNCSCTVTTSLDQRTGQPLSVHHCTTLNGLVLQPIPIQPDRPGIPPSSSLDAQPLGGVGPQSPDAGVNSPGPLPPYGGAYQGEFTYNGGPTVYLPPRSEAKPATDPDGKSEPSVRAAVLEKAAAVEEKAEVGMTEAKPEQSTGEAKTEEAVMTASTSEKLVTNAEPTEGATDGEASPVSEKLYGGVQENRKRTAEFYGQLQKIVNMGNFVDGG